MSIPNQATTESQLPQNPRPKVPGPKSVPWRALTLTCLILSVATFLISLFQVVVHDPYGKSETQYFSSGPDIYGIEVYLLGWFSFSTLSFPWVQSPLITMVGLLGWFANPLCLMSLLLFRASSKCSLVCALLAFLLATVTLLLIGQNDLFRILSCYTYPCELRGGRFTWYTSICLLVAACYFASIREKNDRLDQKALSTSRDLEVENIATESDATAIETIQTEREQPSQ